MTDIEYMDNLKVDIQESKQAIEIEKIRYDSLNSNLHLMEKKMGKDIYTDEYKDIESLSKNPDIPEPERRRYRHMLENMEDEQKYVPEYYAKKEEVTQQEIRYSQAQERYSSSVARELEARNKKKNCGDWSHSGNSEGVFSKVMRKPDVSTRKNSRIAARHHSYNDKEYGKYIKIMTK